MKTFLQQYLPFITGLVSGICFISLGSIGRGLEHFPGDLADARFNNYLLEHAYLFFTGETNEYWNAPFMFPEKDVISYSDNLLGSSPFYIVLRLCGAERLTAFQIWYLLMAAFNYTSAYFFLRYLLRNNYAAVCGAMIFAFSLALQSQMGHAQTYPRFMVPLSLWSLLLFLRELRPRYFFMLLLCLVYQIYCGIYLGFMLAVPVIIMFLVSLVKRPGLYLLRLRDWRWSLKIVAALVLAALVLMPLMLPYFERSKETGFYPFKQVLESLPTPVSFCYSWIGSPLWKFNNNIAPEYPAFWDHQIFPGGIALAGTLICFVLAIYKFRNKRLPAIQFDQNLRLLLISSGICFLLYIRFGHFSFYRLVYELPGFGSMRALQRIINIELIFMGALSAFLLSYLFRGSVVRNTALFFVAVTALIIDNRIDPDYVHKEESQVSERRVSELIGKIGKVDNGVILSYEPDTLIGKQIYYQLDGMLAAQSLGIATLNGYSATSPAGYGDYWVNPNAVSRKTWLNQKKMGEERLLVVH